MSIQIDNYSVPLDILSALENINGFRKGFDLRNKCIEFGEMLSQAREQANLSLDDAARLSGMASERLDDVEMGSLPERLPMVEVEKLLRIYARSVLEHGGEVHMRIDFKNQDGKQSSLDISTANKTAAVNEG